MELLPGACVLLILASLSAPSAAEEVKDTREWEDVTLECRFSAQLVSHDTGYLWTKKPAGESPTAASDHVAYKTDVFDANYKVDFQPEQGRYDLVIRNTSFSRDNGRFECMIRAVGSGSVLHSQSYLLTVLRAPGPPTISPGPAPIATEGKPLELECSSAGGSPEPAVRWYKDGSSYMLDARASTKGSVTTSVLSVVPSRTDDGAVYRCVVSNRAMAEGAKLEAKVQLNVNYFPRVEVGPENPLRVERDGSATLQCKVDAKPKATSVKWSRDGRPVAHSPEHRLLRVSAEDAGRYSCSADNGLGQPGEADILLDVQYPPVVAIDSGKGGAANHREAEEGESLEIHCNVSANPPPVTVEWLRDGRPEFREPGETLRIPRVSSDTAGSYTCRAINVLSPYSQPRRRVEKVSNASITILVRHKPGRARISPDRPVASEGSGVTLTCSANPPGWPAPQYRWWKDGDQGTSSSSSSSGMLPATVLATGQKYTIPSAHLGSEGRYHCQATNEMGHGEPASVPLEVHQAPRFIAKLQPHLTRRVGDSEFSVTCGAQGKPKPSIRWLKDGRELAPDAKAFDVSTDESETRNSVFTIQSTLRFVGGERPAGNQLLPGDRGVYSCVFENEVKRAESSMHLRIEHEPIVLHQYNKVAYDLRDTAEVVCRVQAYPRPEFQWSYGTNAAPLMRSSEGHYDIATSVESGDTYRSVLRVADVRREDYGEYTCRVTNTLGNIRAVIRLQPKGPPERPRGVVAADVGYNHVSLQWRPGFDGGLRGTKYFVSYRRASAVTSSSSSGEEACGRAAGYGPSPRGGGGEGWQEFDCQRNNPCNVSALEQHQTYLFKVKAYNTKGHSDYSDEVPATTRADRIPPPQRVAYDPETHTLSVNLAATCLQLVGLVEAATDGEDWRVVHTLPLAGGPVTRREATVLALVGRHRPALSGGSSLPGPDDEGRASASAAFDSPAPPRVRVKLCLKGDEARCSDYTEAEIGPSYVTQAGALTTPAIVAIIVSCGVFLLCSGLIFVFCRCRKYHFKKGNEKDYEMDSSTVRPSLVTQQPPPPYYPSAGADGKASVEMSLDDPSKEGVYASQNGYGYHGGAPAQVPVPAGHNANGGEWVNLGYMDNSYSNSNNGGSVNSQDSLWQMKMAAQANNNANNVNSDHHHHLVDRTNSYGYDPLTHGGYGAVDDYAPYPHLSGSPEHEYRSGAAQQRGSNNPSRQDYAGDPYAAVHKQKRRVDQHLDSPYHDVSGLPDPYMDQLDCDESKPQHISLSFDESLESGYSTPNSRNRRVIREIIV
ncbi:hemicentin-1 [Bacillus rossius redtenbacheri]|uniref:hemicentin-1 n=1 Tax=Bacillus rossius redtenbacheri TaxID=93214 RepID=UPI002FDF019E